MPRRWTAPAAVLLAIYLATTGAFGQEGRGTVRLQNAGADDGAGRKWAVVIGVNEYIDPALATLKYGVADAELVAKRLVERCGYEEDRVLLITDSQARVHLRPLKENLQRQVQDWLMKAGPRDTVLVFFAGHGFLDARGQGFLATQDCKRENLGLTALRTDDLRDMLRQCKAAQKVLVLDCCHAGGDRDDGKTGASPEELGASFRGAEGLITLASCRKDQASREWPAKGHGLFTYFLAEGLSGEADKAGDRNGLVDSDELYNYCLDKVSLIGQKELNARQTPVRIIGEDVVGRFILARVGGGAVRRDMTITVVPVGEPVEHPFPVRGVALSPDGRFGLSTSIDSTVFWDTTGERVTTRPLPNNGDFGGAFSPDGRLFLTTTAPKLTTAAQLWELPTGQPFDPPMDHEDIVLSAAFSPDGRTLLTRGGVEVRLWDTTSRRMLRTPLVHRNKVTCAAFSPDGKTVLTGSGIVGDRPENPVSGGTQGEARFWSVATGKPIGKPLSLTQPIITAEFGKGGHFYTNTSDGRFQLWHPGDAGPVAVSLEKASQCAAFSPDGTRLVTGGLEDEACLWDVATAKRIIPSSPLDCIILTVAFSPDGALILTGGFGTNNKGEAQLWDARTGRRVGPPMVHEKVVQCVAFSGDGRKIMTGGWDNKARLWEVRREE